MGQSRLVLCPKVGHLRRTTDTAGCSLVHASSHGKLAAALLGLESSWGKTFQRVPVCQRLKQEDCFEFSHSIFQTSLSYSVRP